LSLTRERGRRREREDGTGDELGRPVLAQLTLNRAVEPVDPFGKRTPPEEVLTRLIEIEQRGARRGGTPATNVVATAPRPSTPS
jgi:hypothetical protein